MKPGPGAFAALAVLAAAACSTHRVLSEAAPAPSPAFDAPLVAEGARLAAIGNCVSCHTADGGKSFAGGRPMKTPFGTVYGTNITPDPDTGIGRWSEAAYARAMREGVGRDGSHLYPAFPYDHFTRLTDADVRALYAFSMTREPVRYQPPANRMLVPRFLVGAWKALYFEPGVFRPDAARSAEWNRGAYLVDGLGHCGACHTPRNALGAEKKGRYLAGGEVDEWHAPALNAESPSPVPWTEAALQVYLRTGVADAHAITAGPMSDVVRNLAEIPESDLRAMSVYLVSQDARPAAQRERQARDALAAAARPPTANRALARGARVYAGACRDCHDRGRAAEGGALQLPLAIGLTIPTPRNLIHIVHDGIVPMEGEHSLWMPDYRGALSEDELVDLIVYLRALTPLPPWPNVRDDVRKVVRSQP